MVRLLCGGAVALGLAGCVSPDRASVIEPAVGSAAASMIEIAPTEEGASRDGAAAASLAFADGARAPMEPDGVLDLASAVPRQTRARQAARRAQTSGAPELRDRAVWAACRPQAIAERCMQFDPSGDGVGLDVARSFLSWRRRNDARLAQLYALIDTEGGLRPGDVDRSFAVRARSGPPQTRADVAHQNIMTRFCENATLYFKDDPETNLSFPSVASVLRQMAAEAALDGSAAGGAARAACEVPLQAARRVIEEARRRNPG
ncbi:MAG: hypothetical protein AAF909_03215 [Pseudomonadota bacterium]